MPNYPKDDPKWVQAESVVAEVSGGRYVRVCVAGQEYRMKPVEWHDPLLDKTKADVLICDAQGDWYRVWFYEEDISYKN